MWKELFTQPPAAGLERLARIVMAIIGWGALFWMLWALAVTLASPAGGRTPFQVFAIIVEPPLLCIALLGVTARAATCVSLERERGTWESLLTTPCNTGEIITAKLLGCLFSTRWVWLLVGLLWVLGVVSGQLRPAAFVGTVLLVTMLAVCAATVGLLLSLRLKSSLRALTTAMALGLVLSGGYLLCTLPLLMPLGGAKEPPFWLLAPCVPFLLITSMLLGIENLPNSPQMIAACGLGGAFYAVTALTAFLIVWRWFDRLAGRSHSNRACSPTASATLPNLRSGFEKR
jgi:ABC-type transport system involved in multi-copper enzyme maturation permease subunit